MIVQYASDLHIEFPDNKEFLKANPLQPKSDVLLLGGDIVPFAVMHKHKDFFSYVSDHFKTTYWIPGNHEYYYSNAAKRSGTIHEKIKENVFLVNNITLKQEDVRFVFSTLWSKISEANQWQIEQGMSDFHVIKYNEHRFTSGLFNQFHAESMTFLEKELSSANTLKTVVLTHHVPTFLKYPEQYKASDLNQAFAVELYDFIENKQPDYWLYGHHHQNTADFSIGKTQMCTNQLGYVKYEEHQLFSTSKTISI